MQAWYSHKETEMRDSSGNPSQFLKKFAKKCGVANISRLQTRDLLNAIQSQKLETKFPEKIEEMLEEIRMEFRQISQFATLRKKFKYENNLFEFPPYKHMGKTENYSVFLCFRQELQSKLMIHRPLIQRILTQFENFPGVFFELQRKNTTSLQDFQDLEYEMQENLHKARKFIQEFHENLQFSIKSDKTKIQSVFCQNYQNACSCVITLKYSETLENTLRKIVKATEPEGTPPLNLYVSYEKEIKLFPSLQELVTLFQSFFRDTLNLLSNFGKSPLITEEFIVSSLEKIRENIEISYNEIREYLEILISDFSEIQSDVSETVIELSDLDFDSTCRKIEFYDNYKRKILSVRENEIFALGKLTCTQFIDGTCTEISNAKSTIFNMLSLQNSWIFQDIRENLNMIKTKTDIIPITTEQSIEIHKYLIWVKNDFLPETLERISEALLNLTKLLLLHHLEDVQLEENSITIRELMGIEALVDDNIIKFEEFKFEAEEKLQRKIECISESTRKIYPCLSLLDNMDDITKIPSYLHTISQHILEMKSIENGILWIHSEETSMSFPKSTYPEYDELQNYIFPFYHLLKLSLNVQRKISTWLDGQISLLVYDETKRLVEDYHNELTQLQKEYRKVLRAAQDENMQNTIQKNLFKGTVDDPDVLNWPAPLKILSKTIKILENFKPCLSMMKIVCNDHLKLRHWAKMSEITSLNLTPNAGSTLRKLMLLDLEEFWEPLEIVSESATCEQELLVATENIWKKWSEIKSFEGICGNNETLDLFLKNCRKDEESLQMIHRQTLVKPHEAMVTARREMLRNLRENLENYKKLQKEYEKFRKFFENINDTSVRIIENLREFNDFLIEIANKLGIIFEGTTMEIEYFKMQEVSEEMSYDLLTHLEQFRNAFKKFHYLSNDELVELISYRRSQEILLKYVRKCFSFCNNQIDNSRIKIFNYTFTIDLEKLPESFQTIQEDTMQILQQEIVAVARENYNYSEIFHKLPQAIQIGLEIQMTALISDKNHMEVEKMFQSFTRLIKQENITHKATIETCIISVLNHRDFMQSKYEREDFYWAAKLKYYLNNDGKCFLKFLSDTSDFGYEFSGGLSQKILENPNTERCKLSVLLAFFNRHNCAVFSENSLSGKTQTFKSLATAFGIFYVIFPCNNTFSHGILEKIASASSKSNSWVCFKGINKISLENLTIFANFLEIYYHATQYTSSNSFLYATLDSNFPSFEELPVTLKRRFRHFAIIPADQWKVLEVKLLRHGIEKPNEMARKISSLFRLSNDLFRNSYKFSLVSIENILHNVGDESSLLNSLKKAVAPMLDKEDLQEFNEIFREIFNGSEHLHEIHTNLHETLQNSSKKILGSTLRKSYISNLERAYEVLNCRKSLILLGAVCTGKTTALRILKEVTGTYAKFINPSVFTVEQLYGSMRNQQWSDGILTKLLRNHKKIWVIFDSATTDEAKFNAFQSVFNENRNTLSLPTGENIEIDTETRFIFEVNSMKNISPCIVPRCHLIYFREFPEPWIQLVATWIRNYFGKLAENLQQLLSDMLSWLIPPLLEHLNTRNNEYSFGDFHKVQNCLQQVKLLLQHETYTKKDEDMKNLIVWTQASVLRGVYIGFSSCLNQDSLLKFDQFFKETVKNQKKDFPQPATLEKLDVNVPSEGLFNDYIFIYKGRGNFKHLHDVLKNEKIIAHGEYAGEILVPTEETLKLSNILKLSLEESIPVLLVGPTGSSKTLSLMNFANTNLEKYSPTFLGLIPAITPEEISKALRLNLMKNNDLNGKNYRKNMIIIEDLNLGPCEIFREVLEHHSYPNYADFSLDEYLDNFGIVASMSENSKKISGKLFRHFTIYKTTPNSDDNIVRIFSNLLQVVWKNEFSADISIAHSLANATLKIYKFCEESSGNLKFSYNFRDFLKVLRGLFQLKKETTEGNKKMFFRIWTHEILRSFMDRIENPGIKNELSVKLIKIYENVFEEIFEENLIDSHFGKFNSHYTEINIDEFLEKLNEVRKEKITIFPELLTRVIKIKRLLDIANSHGFLFGQGKKTALKLAAKLSQSEINTPYITLDYTREEWHGCFRKILVKAGGGTKVVLNLTEEQNYNFLLDDIFFYIKNLDVPLDLFDENQDQKNLKMVRLDAQNGNENLNVSPSMINKFFLKETQENLHIFMSYHKLLSLNSKHIELMRVSTPIWFEEWTNDALLKISNGYLGRNSPTETFVNFYRDAQEFFEVNPLPTSSYVEFLKLFNSTLEIERNCIETKRMKFVIALGKLRAADEQIKTLQENLATYHVELNEMTRRAQKMSEKIERESLQVEMASNLVRNDEKIANKQAADAEILKLDCEADLAQAIPILEDAILALNTLKPSDITLVKSMKNPPDAIKLVMAAVCVIKDIKPDKIPDVASGKKTIDYWGPSKRILGDMNFLQTLKDFDKDNIRLEIMQKIRNNYLSHKDFKPHVVVKASSAAEGLCKWIIAMDMYDRVAKEVAPKKEKLEKAEKEYAQTISILNAKKLEVLRLEKELAMLNRKLNEANKRQKLLQVTADACNRKLQRFVFSISHFETEKLEWENQIEHLDEKLHNSFNEVMLQSAFISYLSQLVENDRKVLLNKWKRYIGLEHFNLVSFENFPLSHGLMSHENIYKENCNVYAYSYKSLVIIDPHGVGKTWIQENFSQEKLKFIKYNCRDFMKRLKLSILRGKFTLIYDVGENIPPCLNPLFKRVKIRKILLETTPEIEMNPNFKLMLITYLENPKFSREMSKKIRVLNFSLPKEALRKHLLDIVIETENPLIRNQLEMYANRANSNEEILKHYERNLLQTLEHSKCNLLEDENALKLLRETKRLHGNLRRGENIPVRVLDNQRIYKENYAEFAIYSCDLFYETQNFLRRTQTKLQFTLENFIKIYRSSILNAKFSKAPQKRKQNLTEYLTLEISKKVRRIIALKHESEFLFSLALQLTGNSAYLENFPELKTLETFRDFPKFIEQQKDCWDNYINSDFPELHTNPWKPLSPIHTFVLITHFRKDRTENCSRIFVEQSLGETYLKPIDLNFHELFSESYNLSPILILVENTDFPINSLEEFAVCKKFKGKLFTHILSEHDGDYVEKLLEEAMIEGLWVCLVCINKTWEKLEELILNMNDEGLHENFRLFLIFNVETYSLSLEVSQKCVMFFHESHSSFKENLRKYCNEYFCESNLEISLKIPTFRILYLHAMLKWHRRVFFNAPYDNFSNFDLEFSVNMLKKYGYFQLIELLYTGKFKNLFDLEVSEIMCKEINEFHENSFKLLSKSDVSGLLRKLENYLENSADFGLHEAIFRKINYKSERNSLFFEIQDKNATGMKKVDLEIILENLGSCVDIGTLPQGIPNFLRVEVEFCMKLVRKLKKILERILETWQSLTNIPEDFHEISMNQIPKRVRKHCFLTRESFTTFTRSLKKRLMFLKIWIQCGQPGKIWLGSLNFPRAFLVNYRIEYCKKYNFSIANTSNMFKVCDGVGNLKITGLFLMNASLDENLKIGFLPRIIYFSEPKCISIIPLFECESENENVYTYRCPVNKVDFLGITGNHNGKMGNFITTFSLKCSSGNAISFAKLRSVFSCEKPE